ncbi:MAG TPA: hypothetical protein VFR07_07235 [Mycobacteriales bacterium]|nr:hypothetical protein [Mycobacteriales bacterium]
MDVHALKRQGWTVSAIARHLGHDRKTIRAYLSGERVAGQRAPAASAADPLEAFVDYLRQRLADDPHIWAVVLYEEAVRLGFDRSYPTFTRGLRAHRLRSHCEPCSASTGRTTPSSRTRRARKCSGTGWCSPSRPRRGGPVRTRTCWSGRCPHRVAGAACWLRPSSTRTWSRACTPCGSGGLPKVWRFDRMATVASPNTGRVTATFAAVAKHYQVQVALCPPRHGNRKGVVEKANHSAAQRCGAPSATT